MHYSRDWSDSVLMCLQLPTLGRVYGLLVISGQMPWKDLVSYAMLPYGEARFWTNASQHYRTFAVLFIAYALEVSTLTNLFPDGRIYGLLFISRHVSLKDLMGYAMLPYRIAHFWQTPLSTTGPCCVLHCFARGVMQCHPMGKLISGGRLTALQDLCCALHCLRARGNMQCIPVTAAVDGVVTCACACISNQE